MKRSSDLRLKYKDESKKKQNISKISRKRGRLASSGGATSSIFAKTGTNRKALSEARLVLIMRFFPHKDLLEIMAMVCKEWYEAVNLPILWKSFPTFQDSKLVEAAFRHLGEKTKGTEGRCLKVQLRSTGKLYALKKARVYPQAEGVPYYMLRELAFLRGLKHPHIASVETIALANNDLFVLFQYVNMTLFELINPLNDPTGGAPLPIQAVRNLLFQALQGMDFCHNRGVLHRNLKPKHLLVDLGKEFHEKCRVKDERKRNGILSGETLEVGLEDHQECINAASRGHATVSISDFALVRSTSIPLRKYTSEVVTLWYRAPEILMGGTYFAAVDTWSMGCVFGEMVLGKPLFPGICDVDQLFQIFSKLGTPTAETWPGFETLPNSSFRFPHWPQPRTLHKLVPGLDPCGLDLLHKMLQLDPAKRLSAAEALRHPFFDNISEDAEWKAQNRVDLDLDSFYLTKGRRFGSQNPKTLPKENKTLPARKESKTESKTWLWAANPKPPRKKSGLADLAYLARYYDYLKTLESQMFPLHDYLAVSCADSDQVGGLGFPEKCVGTKSVNSGNGNGSPKKKKKIDLQPLHRAMLVDWLVEVVDVSDMCMRSVFLTVNFVDRFMANQVVKRKSFQLLGATCLHIASKCEDVSYIGVEDLTAFADNVFQDKDVLALEEKVLNALDFKLAVPTTLDFFNVFAQRLFTCDEEDENVLMGRKTTKEVALRLALDRERRKKDQKEELERMHLELQKHDASNSAASAETRDKDPKPVPVPEPEKPQKEVPELDWADLDRLRETPRKHLHVKATFLGRFLIELSLQEDGLIREFPSKIAAAALALAIHSVGPELDIFVQKVATIADYSLQELEPVVRLLWSAQKKAPDNNTFLKCINKRYLKPEHKAVASERPVSERLLNCMFR